jgi:protocatechuate 4,5-dioxygenase beta chain
MAKLIGGLGTSHIPAIGGAIHRGDQQTPYWKPFFDAFPPIHAWLGEKKPDVIVIFYNDHGLNFFLDKMPTFAVGAATQYVNSDEGWGIPSLEPLRGEVDLSWHIINTLVDKEFDVVTCQDMLVDHACSLPLKLFYPEGNYPVTVVPVCINTVQFPLPKASRCYALGKAVGQAIQSWGSDKKVAVLASGGLSHQLDGERAGFINKQFDLQFLQSLETNPEWATQFSVHELVEKTGTQGVELLMWLAMRGALTAAGFRREEGQQQLPHSHFQHRHRRAGAGNQQLSHSWVCQLNDAKEPARMRALLRGYVRFRNTPWAGRMACNLGGCVGTVGVRAVVRASRP